MLKAMIVILKRLPFILQFRQMLISIYKLPWFIKLLREFKKINNKTAKRFDVSIKNLYPCLEDNTSKTSFDSLSCMHAVEHIGLGRYGDVINPDADLIAIKEELIRVLAPHGKLLFVVPIGKPKLMFNGHRIYSFDQIADYFSDLDLIEHSIIPDDSSNGIVSEPSVEFVDSQNYGCGLFLWGKKG